MLTLFSILYETTCMVYAAQETIVEEEMRRAERDYTEEEFLKIMEERLKQKKPR